MKAEAGTKVTASKTLVAMGSMVAACFALVLAVSPFAEAVPSFEAGVSEETTEYQMNENGLTYGTCVEAGLSAELPDLVLVVATNGKEGYVYRDELEKAEGASASTPEEAVRMTEEQDRLFRESFISTLEEKDYAISEEEVGAIAEEARYGSGTNEDIVEYASQLIAGEEGGASRASGAKRNAECAEKDVQQAIRAAIEASGELLMVYDKDGKTVIGEFCVGGM
ncbi:hypothetical protein PZH32_03110 [Adlercreutzia equolifaciens]|uniref:hypothetical protein n=1 Tax=Adlercreutzia equolifaciens TaxID=446660 RepID=UPI0023AFFD47|nr:hypothetical protein [Adlercreutzia equolifaciens]MDE8701946.1 hypothetical protein [Adlercreutzia equolifaciens]